MSRFQVITEELVAAGANVERGDAELGSARAGVGASVGAAAGTPAAGAYEALVGDGARALAVLQSTVQELSRALGQAAANYVTSDDSAAGSYLPGGPR